MIKKLNIKFSIFIICAVIISSYLIVSLLIGNDKFNSIKLLLDNEKRQLIKRYIFPYKPISEQKLKITQQKDEISKQQMQIDKRNKEIFEQKQKMSQIYSKLELSEKKISSNIEIDRSVIKLSNNLLLNKYRFTSGFYAGIHHVFPGSGYIDFYENNLFVVSSRGVLAFSRNLEDDKENFKQIKNNIDEFINFQHFEKNKSFSLKDLLIFDNKIYISYSDEIEKDCWNTSIIYGEINYENIRFKKLFLSKECIHSKKNIDKEFGGQQSGGRMISFDENHILLTTGDYRSRHLAQNENSIAGKILKINIYNNDYKIISMGHRNPQGLNFDKENNFILETEHGPQGGDEINLIEVKKINENSILNYGWAISSAGEHYGGKNLEKNKKKYEKYPLYNSHSKYGFIEPLKSFVPSIGISEIVKIAKNKYVVSSLKDKSIYFFELNEQRNIINVDRLEVFERVRDLIFKNNQLYLFMENSASIGVINIK